MGFISEAFSKIGIDFFAILSNPQVVATFMFISLFIGIFSLFKALLRFIFARGEGPEFHKKELNTIAFMISFMGSSGLFFMFRGSPEQIIYTFGGTAGLLLVTIISILLMKFFYSLALSHKEAERKLFWFWIVLGLFFSVGLLVLYLGKLIQLGLGINIYEIIYGFLLGLFQIIVIALIIIGFIALTGIFAKGKIDREEQLDANPNLRKARDAIARLSSNVKKMDNSMVSISNILRGEN